MFISAISQAGALAMALVCLLACLVGRWPERLAAVTLALNWVGCEAVQARVVWHHPQTGIFLIDAAYLALLVAIAVRSARHWILFAAAFQLMIVMTHVATFADARINQWEFFSAYFAWSYLILIAMAAGALIEGRRSPAPPAEAFPPRRSAAAAL